MNHLLAALALLTIVPVHRQLDFSARVVGYFPFVGILVGLVLLAADLGLRLVFPSWVTAALVTAVWALVTGGLHLDGLSDAFDGLFAATTRERRLEILKDVHLGAFGAIGLVLVLMLKFAAVTNVNPLALLLAPVLGRWAIVYAAGFPLARKEGMAALFARGLARREITIATVTVFVCALPLGWFGAASWVTAAVTATLLARFALARLGGLTGDIYGLICEVVEVAVLLVATTFSYP